MTFVEMIETVICRYTWLWTRVSGTSPHRPADRRRHCSLVPLIPDVVSISWIVVITGMGCQGNRMDIVNFTVVSWKYLNPTVTSLQPP